MVMPYLLGKILWMGRITISAEAGQHIGTIWGHGSYLAPDWSADFLHRMGLYIAARHHGLSTVDAHQFTQADFDNLDPEERARLSVIVQDEIKTNRFDPADGSAEVYTISNRSF